MQNPDRSVLSVLSVASQSPPSAANQPSYYEPVNTSATLSAASAFSLASKVLGSSAQGVPNETIAELELRATNAWDWAELNPNVIFKNNDPSFDSVGLAAGQQEVDDEARKLFKLSAAVYLADLTNDQKYFNFVEQNYDSTLLVASKYISPFKAVQQRDLLYYASLPNTSEDVKTDINTSYQDAFNDERFWSAVDDQSDPYFAYIDQYGWGSNNLKAQQGIMYLQLMRFGLGVRSDEEIMNTASHYAHYLHGVNPLGLVYLSNMTEFGAERSVTTLYHSWFADGSTNWDSTETSNFGPVPGLLVGGPNPGYVPDQCCPQSCGSQENDQMCEIAYLPPLAGNQPDQKAYLHLIAIGL